VPGIPADQVLAQNPAANAKLQRQDQPAGIHSRSPRHHAQFRWAAPGASRTLQDSGFKLGNVNVVTPPTPAPGDAANAAELDSLASGAPPVQAPPPPQATPASIIVAQSPAAGQKVYAGTAVNFDVK
jgi:hypothetical protein